MKMTARTTEDILREKGWKQHTSGLYWHWDYLRQYTAEEALEIECRHDPPAPRPTCGTCPHWVELPEGEDTPPQTGSCQFVPVPSRVNLNESCDRDWSCSQHPDMGAWIEKEWPKVKR
jgi:hypothetical protein